MSTILKDGIGTGNLARVDSNHELRTRSRSNPVVAGKALDGDTYSMATTKLSVTTSVTGKLWYFQNSETEDYFALDSIRIYWDGGSTNYNRTAEIAQYTGGAVAPTTNTTSGLIGNTNLGSAKTFAGTYLYWNGSSTGMSGDVAMYQIGSFFVSPGLTTIDYQGLYLFEPSRRYAFSAAVPEDGELVIQVIGYRVDVDFDGSH